MFASSAARLLKSLSLRRAASSAGRAPGSQSGGRGFEPRAVHQAHQQLAVTAVGDGLLGLPTWRPRGSNRAWLPRPFVLRPLPHAWRPWCWRCSRLVHPLHCDRDYERRTVHSTPPRVVRSVVPASGGRMAQLVGRNRWAKAGLVLACCEPRGSHGRTPHRRSRRISGGLRAPGARGGAARGPGRAASSDSSAGLAAAETAGSAPAWGSSSRSQARGGASRLPRTPRRPRGPSTRSRPA